MNLPRSLNGNSAGFLAGLALLLAAAAAVAPTPASAAESFDGCAKRTITSLPAKITTQGRWCLAGDLSTAMATGPAIHIVANNVALDCNGFHVTGTAASETTQATAVLVVGSNATVHGCRVSGFRTGLKVVGDSAVVDGNFVRRSSRVGIQVAGDGGTIRGNSVVETGDDAEVVTSSPRLTAGIVVDGNVDVIDNLIASTWNRGTHPGERAYAVRLAEVRGTIVRGNRMRKVLAGAGETSRYGGGVRLGVNTSGISVQGNDMFHVGIGVECTTASTAILRDNTLQDNDTTLHTGCIDGGGNAAPVDD